MTTMSKQGKEDSYEILDGWEKRRRLYGAYAIEFDHGQTVIMGHQRTLATLLPFYISCGVKVCPFILPHKDSDDTFGVFALVIEESLISLEPEHQNALAPDGTKVVFWKSCIVSRDGEKRRWITIPPDEKEAQPPLLATRLMSDKTGWIFGRSQDLNDLSAAFQAVGGVVDEQMSSDAQHVSTDALALKGPNFNNMVDFMRDTGKKHIVSDWRCVSSYFGS